MNPTLSGCGICGSEDFSIVLRCRDYNFYSPVIYNIIKCSRCGQVRIDPFPRDRGLSRLLILRRQPGKIDRWYFLNPCRRKIVERFKKRGRLLDIGCGRGEFPADMQKHGWEVYGNDISADVCAYAKKEFALEHVYSEDLLKLDLPDKFFDVVTLWHVFGCLESPLGSLRKINRLLKDDGILIIESPNFYSLQRRFFKEKWFGLSIPYYWYLYSPESLEKVLALAGLKIISRDYFVNPRTDFVSLKRGLLRWLRLERVPDERGERGSFILLGLRKNRVLHKLLRFIFEFFCCALSVSLSLINCGDTFRVYCRKAL